jgi:hypothetical protein
VVCAVRVFARSRAEAPGINGISKVQGELRFPSLFKPKHGIEGAGVGLGPVGATDCQILLPAFRLGRHEAAAGVKALVIARQLGVKSWTGFDPEFTLCWQSVATLPQVVDY